jgi:hypothetical protein
MLVPLQGENSIQKRGIIDEIREKVKSCPGCPLGGVKSFNNYDSGIMIEGVVAPNPLKLDFSLIARLRFAKGRIERLSFLIIPPRSEMPSLHTVKP